MRAPRAITAWRCTTCSARPAPLRPPRRPPCTASARGRTSAGRPSTNATAGLDRGVKENALLDLLRRNPEEKKMVFVHHRETLLHLDDLLREHGLPFVRFEGSHVGTGEGRRDRGVSRPGAGAALHPIRRRRAQRAVLQHPDQLRPALESDGHRAAHRPPAPHRADAGSVHLQPGGARYAGKPRAAHPGREDQHVRAGGGGDRRHPGRTGRDHRTSPNSSSPRGWKPPNRSAPRPSTTWASGW